MRRIDKKGAGHKRSDFSQPALVYHHPDTDDCQKLVENDSRHKIVGIIAPAEHDSHCQQAHPQCRPLPRPYRLRPFSPVQRRIGGKGIINQGVQIQLRQRHPLEKCHKQHQQKCRAGPDIFQKQIQHRCQQHQQDDLVHEPEHRIEGVLGDRLPCARRRNHQIRPVGDRLQSRNPARRHIRHVVDGIPEQVRNQKRMQTFI